MEIVPVDVEGYEYTAFFIPELDINAPGGCFVTFPQFQEDFEILWEKEIITIDKEKIKFKWNRTDLSLAQYFYNQKKFHKAFWSAVAFDFNIDRAKLRQAIYMNRKQNNGRHKDSRDYEEIKDLLNL